MAAASGMGGNLGQHHNVTALKIDPATGALSPHGAAIELPRRPIHMTTDIPSENILVAFSNPSGLHIYKVNPDGTPWDGCARTFLKQAIADLAAEGYELQASFEPEFTLGRREGAELVPVDESLCYSATGFHLAHDYIIDLVAALNKQGLEVEHYYPELGHGQQEVPIRHATALRAVDNHVLLRETARAVAIRQGLWASFAPKPLPDQAGNGAHLHASLWAGGSNAFADPSGKFGMSRLGYRFLAGVLAHLPGLVALTCGTVNSYRRLAPSMWAGAFACWGPDNREAAVRLCSPIGAAAQRLRRRGL